MPLQKLFTCVPVLPIVLVSGILSCAPLPPDPGDPLNTAIKVFIKSRDNKIHTASTFTGIAGDTVDIGCQLTLPQNMNFVRVVISMNGTEILNNKQPIPETMTSFNKDTLWIQYTAPEAGEYFLSVQPQTNNIEVAPATIQFTMEPPPPENRKPTLSYEGATNLKAADTCKLTITVKDPDPDQQPTIVMTNKHPDGALFVNSIFTWVTPSEVNGIDSVVFIANDNGAPIKYDTLRIQIRYTYNDTDLPKITLIEPIYGYDNDTVETVDQSVSIKISCTDLSGIRDVELECVGCGKYPYGFIPIKGTDYWTTTLSGVSDGRKLNITVIDNANKIKGAVYFIKRTTFLRVIYKGNGNTSGDVPIDATHYPKNGIATLLTPDTTFINGSMQFFGWNTIPDGSGIHYHGGDEIQLTTYSMRFYAIWADPSQPVVQ